MVYILVSVLALSVVECVIEPGRVKLKTKIGICCFPAKHTAVMSNDLDNQTGLLVDCCFSELALSNYN